MARNAAAIELQHDRLERFSGDATDHEAIRRSLDGVDAVLITLGIGSGPTRLLRPVTLFSRSTDVIVSEMLLSGPRRLIVVTGYGAGDSHGAMNAIEGVAHGLILGRAYADKGIQEDIVKRSGLDWTIVRPTILTNGPEQGNFQVLSAPESWRNGLISRADVAKFLVERALDRQYLQEAPVLAY